VNGVRNEEQRAGFNLARYVRPANLDGFPVAPSRAGAGESPVFKGMLANAPTWEDIAWLSAETRLPLLLKGIVRPEDAERAIAAGAEGIVVSNHGGRTLDTQPASVEALDVVAQRVRGRVPLLVDGGIRRGTDVLKCLALGASAVIVGQPIVHALAVAGAVGVAHLLTILRAELEAAMALTGCASLAQIDRSVLWSAARSG
jgi:4-hydroxymandelate oxidase